MKINCLRIAYILVVSILFIVSCTDKQGKNSISEISIDPTFFSSFSDFNHYAAKFRVGAEMDTTLYHFRIKAITIANFDEKLYRPQSVYILTHQSSDSIVIKTEDTPLISYEEFKRFYNRHKEEMRADTIINSQVFDKFFKIEHNDIVDVESFDHLPFLFLDVNFNGYPALLVRNRYDEGQDFYYYKVYGITPNGFHEVKFEPYLSIKNRVGPWCFGGSTAFNFKDKTIKVFSLSHDSCSDYGTEITDTYTLNPITEKFEKTRMLSNYDFN